MKNFLLGFACCAFIAVLFSVVWSRDDGHSNNIVTASLSPAPAPSLRINQLERENIQLKLQVAELSNRKISLAPTVAPHADEVKAEAAITPQMYAESLQTMQRAAEFSHYTNSLQEKNQTMLSDLSEKFSLEAVDYSWAPDYQRKITHIFGDTDYLKNVSPSAIECRTHKCQIKIPITDNDEANKLTQAFATALETNKHDVAKTEVIATPDFAQGLLTLYIAKNNTLKAYE